MADLAEVGLGSKISRVILRWYRRSRTDYSCSRVSTSAFLLTALEKTHHVFKGQVVPGTLAYCPHSAVASQFETQPAPQ